MPYPANHRTEKKRAIIDSARKLFNRSGFDNVSFARDHGWRGLTHGGFYSYFKSKSDLYAEVLGCFFTDPNWKSCWEGVKVDLSSTDVGSQVVHGVSVATAFRRRWRILAPWWRCQQMFARSGPSAKGAFETVFRAMVSVLERSMTEKQQCAPLESSGHRCDVHRRHDRRSNCS